MSYLFSTGLEMKKIFIFIFIVKTSAMEHSD